MKPTSITRVILHISTVYPHFRHGYFLSGFSVHFDIFRKFPNLYCNPYPSLIQYRNIIHRIDAFFPQIVM